MPKFQLHPVRASAIILILFLLGFSIYSFANAWVEPGTNPPGGNVAAPLHTGTTPQTKQGSLAVSAGGIYAQGASYGVYGVNTSNGAYGLLGYAGYGGYFHGPIYTDSYMLAPIFYDANDSGYYVDPNGNSNLNKLNLSRTGAGECCSGGDATLSLSESTSSTGKKAGVQFHNGGVSEGQLRLDSGTNGRELKAYSYQTDMDLHATGVVQGDQGLCINGDCRSGWPATNLGDWYFSGDNFVSNGWGHIYTSSSNLHLDSYSGEMYLNYYYNNWVNVGNRDTGYLFIGNTQLYDDNNWFQIYSGANNRIYTNSYLRVDNNFEVQGNIYCASCGGWLSDALIRWNTWQYGNYYQTNGDIYMGWAGNWLSTVLSNKLRLNTWQGNHYSGSDGAEYATIFYDTNNSGYYVDPNGSSRMNQLYYVDSAYVVDLRPQYMYDWNDTNYYMDFNNTSKLNSLITNGRIYSNEWIQMNNYSGLYSPNNGAHFYPNNGSYGSWRIAGSRNGWYGLEFDTAAGQTSFMVGHSSQGWGSQQIGFHNNSHGWLWYSYGRNMYADSFRDIDNGSYYVDPNGTTVLNVVYANQYNCMSDLELKKDIKPIGNALDKVLSIKGVSFTWKDEEMGTGNQVGVIAQDVEKVLPEVVTTNEQGLKAVDYSKLTPLIIESIKDLKIEKDGEVNNLREKIDNLEADGRSKEEIINDLKRRIEALESK